MNDRTREAIRALTEGPEEQRRALVALVRAAGEVLEMATPRDIDLRRMAGIAAVILARREQGKMCPRCGADYDPNGSCSRRQDGCQGGRGESPWREQEGAHRLGCRGCTWLEWDGEAPGCRQSQRYLRTEHMKEAPEWCEGREQEQRMDRCEWCDPSFGCFSAPATCCKRPVDEIEARDMGEVRIPVLPGDERADAVVERLVVQRENERAGLNPDGTARETCGACRHCTKLNPVDLRGSPSVCWPNHRELWPRAQVNEFAPPPDDCPGFEPREVNS